MVPGDFAADQRANLQQLPGGIWAYVPPPAPASFALPPKLINALAEASRAIGDLDGTGRHLPNPHLLIGPYLRREAVLSSRIEGTQTGLSQLLMFEADSSEPTQDDAREVRNYVLALETGIERLPKLPLSLRLVRELHARLMEGVRGGKKDPGEFRSFQNYVGPKGAPVEQATYVPPPVPELDRLLSDWELFLHRQDDIPLLLRCAWMHYQFESMHPFIDGNGRIGRLLIPLLLIDRRALTQPLLYVSAHLERNRDAYYEALMAGRLRGDLDPWFELFLTAVTAQALEATTTAERLSALRGRYHDVFAKSRSPIVRKLTDEIFGRLIVNVPDIARRFRVSQPAAQSAVNALVEHGILREVTGRKRKRSYLATEIVSLIMPEEALPSESPPPATQRSVEPGSRF